MPTAILTSSRRGGTLIEVLAALALLGGVLTSSLVGIAKFRAAISDAKLRAQAVNLADELLTQWRSMEQYPARAEGEFREPGWHWRTDARPCAIEGVQSAEIVRLEILMPERQVPILSIEIMTAPAPPVASPPQESEEETNT